MKKLILSIFSLVAFSFVMTAQDVAGTSENVVRKDGDTEQLSSNVWKRTRFFNVSYVTQDLEASDAGAKWKSKFGVAASLGNTYLLHRRPIAGLLKFGLDVKWFDINYVQYKDDIELGGKSIAGYTPNIDEEENPFDNFDIDMQQLDAGIGVGPSVHIAPFAKVGHGLEYLKASLYFHFTPSYSAILTDDEDGDVEFNHGFCPFFNFGGAISYKLISVGFESRLGSAKYKMAGFDDVEIDPNDPDQDYEVPEFGTKGKQKFKTSSLRVYLSLRF